jgi:hypothetical protein
VVTLKSNKQVLYIKIILFSCSFKKYIAHEKVMDIVDLIPKINLTNQRKHPVIKPKKKIFFGFTACKKTEYSG